MGYLDAVVGAAEQQLRQVAASVVNHSGHPESAQSVTIASDLDTVQQLFRDPARLSQVLGDIAEVRQGESDDKFRWVFRRGPLDGASWQSVLVTESNRLRFVDADPGGAAGTEIILEFAAAPRDQGTEVTLRVKSPTPGLLSGALGFKALYRARALLQTGEIPTIRKNPSARKSAR